MRLTLLFIIFLSCSSPDKKDPSEIFSPKEAIADMQLADKDLVIEVVAAEPLVEDPVALDFDEKGNMWVVEMRGYMNDKEGGGENQPLGRIKLLKDINYDGLFDTASIVLDSLVLPRAIAIVDKGFLLIEPPKLFFVEFTNGKAGAKTIIDSAFADAGNVEHQPNGLLKAIDNWIYCAKSNKRIGYRNGKWIIEPTLFRGQWGITQDAAGRLYYNENSITLMTDQMLPSSLRNNPHHNWFTKDFTWKRLVSNKVFPRRHTKGINRAYQKGMLDSTDKLVNVTSACGPVIYLGDHLPLSYHGNAFVMEPAAYLIKRIILENDYKTGSITGKFAYADDEFITSTDERFRPVNAYNSPDGSLMFIDMHRGIIQHTTYLTPYLRRYADSLKLERPVGMGRIYRIRSEGKLRTQNDLSTLSAIQLVDLLKHKNAWHRQTAQRLLIARGDTTIADTLNKIFISGIVHERIHALYTLHGLGLLTSKSINASYEKGEDYVHRHILTILSENPIEQFDHVGLLNLAAVFPESHKYDFIQAMLTDNFSSTPTEIIKQVLLQNNHDSLFADVVMSTPFAQQYPNPILDQLNGYLIGNAYDSAVMKRKRTTQVNINHLSAVEKEQYYGGRSVYQQYCATCHGTNGEGIVNVAPELAGSEWVTGDKNRLTSIILDGLEGPISVNGKQFSSNASMPGIRNNIETNNGTIANVITYIRNSWGNKAGGIKVEEVGKQRSSTESRKTPYTEEELKKFSPTTTIQYKTDFSFSAYIDTTWQSFSPETILAQWRTIGGPAKYAVEDNSIVGIVTGDPRNTFLVSPLQFGDFILEVDVMIDTGINSGIQIRSHTIPGYKNAQFHGYQIEIDPSPRRWSGGIYDENRRGWLFRVTEPVAQSAFNSLGWNTYRIEANGPHLQTWINGIAVANLYDSMTRWGYIGLQVHGNTIPRLVGRKIRWRNLRIATLK